MYGENNKFGHPDDGVIKKFKEMNTEIFRTDKMGEIEFIIDSKGGIKTKKYIN